MSSGGRRDERHRGLDLALVLFQCAGVILAVYSGQLLSLPWWGQLLILLVVTTFVVALAVAIEAGFRPSSTLPENPLRNGGPFTRMKVVVRGAAKWSTYGVPGIVAALIIFALPTNVWPALTSDGSCDEPIDLRVVTGPENVSPLLEAARRYVVERSRQGCRTTAVTVTENSSIDGLRDGFAGGWTSRGSDLNGTDCERLPTRVTLLGPRPDIWIPASRSVAEGVREDVNTQDACPLDENPVRVKADLAIRGSVGSSPVVMGVFADANRPDLGGEPGKQSLASLLRAFRTNEVLDFVARPSADTSEPALLSTPVLYRALRESGWAGEERATAEEILEQSRISASDPASLLCRFREDDAAEVSPPAGTAVIVPENILARYDYGDELGEEAACQARRPSEKWRLYPYYTSDLPVVELPFVHVRWPGEDTGRRNEAVEDFRNWLANDELTRAGLRTVSGELSADNPRLRGLRNDGHAVPEPMSPHPLRGDTGCVGSLDQILGCYNDTRPTNPVSLLLDISGSMANVVAGGPRLALAQELAQRIVTGVRPETPISLFPFSTVTQPKAAGPAASSNNAAARTDVLGAIQRATVNGGDLALTTAVDQTAQRLRLGRQTLVLLTDGQALNTNPGHADRARDLAEQLTADNRGLRVLIVPTDPTDCGDRPVASIADAFGEGSCVDNRQGTIDDFASAVVSEILWGND